jgi:hypothetical protein
VELLYKITNVYSKLKFTNIGLFRAYDPFLGRRNFKLVPIEYRFGAAFYPKFTGSGKNGSRSNVVIKNGSWTDFG